MNNLTNNLNLKHKVITAKIKRTSYVFKLTSNEIYSFHKIVNGKQSDTSYIIKKDIKDHIEYYANEKNVPLNEIKIDIT